MRVRTSHIHIGKHRVETNQFPWKVRLWRREQDECGLNAKAKDDLFPAYISSSNTRIPQRPAATAPSFYKIRVEESPNVRRQAIVAAKTHRLHDT
ncbi:hypothetical protein IG631_08664 [Alternaria alternata]|nr:hypothetical protein IG631_08664 [Alternaria alternata]